MSNESVFKPTSLLGSPFSIRANSTRNVTIDLADLEVEDTYENGWNASYQIFLRDFYRRTCENVIACDNRIVQYKIFYYVLLTVVIFSNVVSNALQITIGSGTTSSISNYPSIAVNCFSLIALAVLQMSEVEKKIERITMQMRLLNSLRNDVKLIMYTKSAKRLDSQVTLHQFIEIESRIYAA